MRGLLAPSAPVVALVVMLIALPGSLSAQASPQTSTIPSEEAEDFLGQWSLGISGAQGEQISLSIDIRDEDGRVAAEVAADGMSGSEPVAHISRDGERLVLAFLPVIQGQPIPVRIDLRPAGEDLNADVTAADGMFMASGTATRE